MKKLSICLLAGVLLCGATGCTGPFKLTKNVHSWHRSADGKWMDELCFLGVVILPVYFFATLGDVILFNSIEFWGGENPISSTTNLGDNIKLTYNDDGTILLQSDAGNYILQKTEGGVKALDTEGEVLYTSKTGADNKVRVYNADGSVVRTFDKS